MSINIEENVNKALIEIPFRTEREAKIAFNSLRIDREINNKKGFVFKEITFNSNLLIIEYKTKQIKQLRVCLKSILELLEIVIQTIDCFDIIDD